MAFPTTADYLNSTVPAAPPGDQNVTFQSDGAQPEQSITAFPKQATTALRGTVKPDGTSITIDPDGTIHAVVTGGTGGGGGGGTVSASGGFEVVVVPGGAKDGSNTQYTLPAPVLAGTAPKYVRNGVVQRQLGTKAEFAVQGATLTVAPSPITQPLQSTDWHEFYYVQGTPNSESGGGGGVVPTTPGAFIQGASGVSVQNPVNYSLAFPAANGAGNCLIVDMALEEGFDGSSGAITLSDTQGNTYTQVQAGVLDGTRGITFVAFNCAAGSNTVTVHGTGGGSLGNPFVFLLAIHEYGGFGPSAALDSVVYANTSFPTTASVTTTQTLDLLHIFAVARGATPPFTDTAGWTLREAAGPDTGHGVIISTWDAQAGAAATYSNTIGPGSIGTSPCVILLALKTF
jgi:hypothetical protein